MLIKPHIKKYLSGYKNNKKYVVQIMLCKQYKELISIVESIKEE
jgi:hypothetical protein